jgi:pimeloyl-ACP methyl ester carboxylesterase
MAAAMEASASAYVLEEQVGFLLRRAQQRATEQFNAVMAPFETFVIVLVVAVFILMQKEDLRDRLIRLHAHVDNAFWQWKDVWLSEAFERFDITSDCQAITCPVLAVQGTNDEDGSLAQLDRLCHAVPHGQRLELTPCGHSPHRDQPQALTQALEAFLQTLTT